MMIFLRHVDISASWSSKNFSRKEYKTPILVLALLTIFALERSEAQSVYPGDEWQEAPVAVTESVDSLLNYAFPSPIGADRKGVRSDGLVIIQGGRIVLEHYQVPYDANKPHLAWSVSKSVMNALYGIAEYRGWVKRSDPVSDYYRPWNQGEQSRIRIEDLLHWSSGLDWAEGYEASPLTSSVIAMLYTLGRDDMAKYTADHPVIAAPGTRHKYSSGDTNILSAALRNIVGEEHYQDYPWQALFDPLGMRSVTWEQDASGTYVGSSYFYATPRDMARFGYLFLRKGHWKNQQLFAEEWVEFSTTLVPAYVNAAFPKANDKHPGAHWWLNKGVSEEQALAWPDAPVDTYAAWGHWGQYVFVIPSLDLVVVRTGDDRDGSFERNYFLKLVTAAFCEDCSAEGGILEQEL